MITLAFYKGSGKTWASRCVDRAIRSATGGMYSHVELIPGFVKAGEYAGCLSASGRDGGVRRRLVYLKPHNWDLVYMNIDPTGPCEFIERHLGEPYDYTGIVFSQILAFGIHNPRKWFCSEICAAALDFPNPQRVSPQLLFDAVTWGSGLCADNSCSI